MIRIRTAIPRDQFIRPAILARRIARTSHRASSVPYSIFMSGKRRLRLHVLTVSRELVGRRQLASNVTLRRIELNISFFARCQPQPGRVVWWLNRLAIFQLVLAVADPFRSGQPPDTAPAPVTAG